MYDTPYCTWSRRCFTKFCPCRRKNIRCLSTCHPPKTCSNVTSSAFDLSTMPYTCTLKALGGKGQYYPYEEYIKCLIKGG